MQWKIPFSEYLKSDKTKLLEISEEYSKEVNKSQNTNKTNELLLKEMPSERQLSEAQLSVVKRFPQMSDTNIQKYEKFEKLITQWKPESEIWPFVYNIRLLSFLNGMTAFYISHCFRRYFKLADGRTAFLSVYVPSICMPLFFGSFLHDVIVTKPISEGRDDCSICERLKGGLIQFSTSTLYPILFSSVTSIYFADYFSTFPTPDSLKDKVSRNYFYNLLLKAIKRNRTGLTFVGISNFLFAFYLTAREQETIQFMYFSLLQKEFNKLDRNRKVE